MLALGFEQMQPGALTEHWTDRPSPFADFDKLCAEINLYQVPLAIRYFGGAGKEYMEKYGVSPNIFAKVRAKASRHAANNPVALFRKVVTEEDVMAAPVVFPEAGMTRLMACPPTCGAAAALLVSHDFAEKMHLDRRVYIAAQAMTTDRPGTFGRRSMMTLVGTDMTREAADQVYEKAGVGPEDIDVVELHDCFAQNEIITYEGLRLCEEGGADKFVCGGENTYSGRIVTNPSGGLLSKGHPLGATGIAQCAELVALPFRSCSLLTASCAVNPAIGRCRKPVSACSTTSVWAAPRGYALPALRLSMIVKKLVGLRQKRTADKGCSARLPEHRYDRRGGYCQGSSYRTSTFPTTLRQSLIPIWKLS